jgi:biotin synthase
VDPLDIVRVCAVARIMMPGAMVRLSAGRGEMGREAQMLAFMAGANSIFYGDQLLTTGNPAHEEDLALLKKAGMRALVPADREAGRAAATTEKLPTTAAHAGCGAGGCQPSAS